MDWHSIELCKVLITRYIIFSHNSYSIATTIVIIYNNSNKHIHQTLRFLAVWGLLEQADLTNQVPQVEQIHHHWLLVASFQQVDKDLLDHKQAVEKDIQLVGDTLVEQLVGGILVGKSMLLVEGTLADLEPVGNYP